MFTCVCIKKLLFRQLLTVFLVSYLIAILLFIVSVDQTQRSAMTIESMFRAPDQQFSIGATGLVEQQSSGVATEGYHNIYANRSSGDFIALGKDAFIYSAFLDDRNEQTFIRLLALFSKISARTHSVYCHFNEVDIPLSRPLKALHYELCENHDKMYGGYFYSCPLPNTTKSNSPKTVLVSLTKFGPIVRVPLLTIRPPRHKMQYLNRSLGDENNLKSYFKSSDFVPSTNTITTKPLPEFPRNQLSFAICVSPLFGSVSVFRVIEFIELSKLLGAQHIYFYNYSLHESLDKVLQFYVDLNQTTVLPWTLPSQIDEENVWYHSQLLSNNDCLYRTMSRHDLVFFNDIDEFVVPHTEAATWAESFGTFLADDQCGLSFQSAFFDPGNLDLNDAGLVTAAITTRTQKFSKVRTKVMVSPWRVFEVGIHHVSKQNREVWRPFNVDPSVAYLHHYRRCASDYSTNCYMYDADSTVVELYSDRLTGIYGSVLQQMYSKGILKKKLHDVSMI